MRLCRSMNKRIMATGLSVCLSHDVDRVTKTFQYATHFLRHLAHGDLRAASYQVRSLAQRGHYWMFERVMEVEEALGVRSTFFFLNETYPFRPWRLASWRLALGYYDLFDAEIQAVIRRLDARGWEIGLHGSYLSYKDTELLKREKADLERIVGHEVGGIRQHYLNLDPSTWSRQAEAGFLYDASFGYTDDVGFKENRFQPFRPLPDRKFYVIPLAIMDGCVLRKAAPLDEARRVIDQAEAHEACLVLNWHQERFSEKEFPGWLNLYVELVQECRRRGAQFSTIGQYLQRMARSDV